MYAFKHAITRQVSYDSLPFAQRRELHAALARHLESKGGALNYPLLAHHWNEAGGAEKAFEYLVRAGEDAARADANPEAAHFFSRALDVDLTGADMTQEEATLRRAYCHRRLGDVSFALGALDNVREAIHSSFALLAPHNRWEHGRMSVLMRHTLIQACHLLAPRMVETRDAARKRQYLEGSKTAGLLALVRSTPLDTVGLLGASLLSLNLAEKAGTTNVFALGMLGYTAEALGLHRLSRTYFDRARVKAFELNERSEYYGLAVLFDGMAGFGAGDHARIMERLRIDLQGARQIGDRRAVARIAALLGAAGGFTLSVTCSELLQYASEALDANRDQPAVDQAYFLTLHGSLLSMFMRPGDARSLVAPIEDRIDASLERATADAAALAFSMKALFHTRQGNLDEAGTAAERAMSWLRNNVGSVPATGWVLFQGVLEAYLARYRRALSESPSTAPEVARDAREALTALRRYARRHRVYQARSRYFEGQLASLEGRDTEARRLWNEALAAAQRLELPFDEGLARLELARNAPLPQRDHHLVRARELFTPCGAPYYMDRLDAAGMTPQYNPDTSE